MVQDSDAAAGCETGSAVWPSVKPVIPKEPCGGVRFAVSVNSWEMYWLKRADGDYFRARSKKVEGAGEKCVLV